jgi:hypothetical protein
MTHTFEVNSFLILYFFIYFFLLFHTKVHSVHDGLAVLVEAEKRKHRAATAMNQRSSRAHAIVLLTLTQRHRLPSSSSTSSTSSTRSSSSSSSSGSSCGGLRVASSTLYLVDLGGSEQVKKSKAEGARLTEAVEINASLMVLGRVIDALVAKKSHGKEIKTTPPRSTPLCFFALVCLFLFVLTVYLMAAGIQPKNCRPSKLKAVLLLLFFFLSSHLCPC